MPESPGKGDGMEIKMQEARRKPMRKNQVRALRIVIGLLVTVAVAVFVFFLVLKGFVIETVHVVGNEIYSDEQIKSWVLDKEYSWNSMYVMLREKFRDPLEIPFVESIEVSLLSPTEIQIDVTEKNLVGYVYAGELGQNVYFDSDGIVVEQSNDILDGTMQVCGIEVAESEDGEELYLAGSSVRKSLISLMQLLEKEEKQPELIYVEDGSFLLSYGEIQVNLGSGTFLSEKMIRMEEILTQLAGESGTLHLDTFSDSNTDFYFRPGELTSIPLS